MKIGCVILAAGNAARFGKNKLECTVHGKSLIRHTLELVPTELVSTVTVVTQYPAIIDIAKEFHFTAVHNTHPEFGQSHSIQLGLAAMSDHDAVLFMVADQPLLRRETVVRLLELSRRHPHAIVCLSSGGVPGNPCLFPARFYDALRTLQGDQGGRSIRQSHLSEVITLEVEKDELRDIDTPEALAELSR